MSEPIIGYSFAIIAGFAAALLFFALARSDFRLKRAKEIYIFALAFTIASWSGLEWGLWLDGGNLFRLIVFPAVPLDVFFLVWISFALWAGEKLNQRKIAVSWLIILAAIFVIASYCMDCVKL